MGYIDYSREPKSDIAFIDMKSFYASVECVDRGLNPLHTSLCVMSRADNAAGLILASSPMFKKVFGKKNVGRSYDLPFDIKTRQFNYHNAKKLGIAITPSYKAFIEHWAKRTLIVPPRMDRYIEKNLDIQHVFQAYAAPNDILPYSIDEGFIDLTASLNYFIPDKSLSRKTKLDNLSAIIQRDIWRETGIISTIGMSNANPLLAKLALDNEAKKTATMRANWSYEDVESKVWAIANLTDFWGIGRRLEKRLHQLGITTIKELANTNPDKLQQAFGKIGVQLWFHANGVDESNVHEPYKPKSKGLGNSQILPRDYYKQREIEIVLAEMAEQVANRLRKKRQKATVVAIHIGYSKVERRKAIHAQMKIEPANLTKTMVTHVLSLFRQKYRSGAVRQIGVSYSGFVDASYGLLSLFDDVEQIEKEDKLQTAIDTIRDRFGFLAIQKGTVLTDGSRNKERSKLIGGHSAGGLEGLK
ncbi:Y-family DNA polymerase [Streptococcus sp. DD12]|uniref:Y-family DNA polymerase n=1 Tax=Streptococcus sp. DD12 TaxID=1777880 RepID=UPI0007960E97|nr:Y-family DNA polymerase [Streptococcus sp. DD12]KXT77034.1 ImpB/MucB/SamB family protein [Streptococcus sp. DD12]